MKNLLYILFYSFLFCCCSGAVNQTEEDLDKISEDWTMMFYLGADNNLEYDLLRNVKAIKESYQGGCNVIVFIDRSASYSINSTIFGENFSECRIYRVKKENRIELLEKEDYFYNTTPDNWDYNFNSANILVLKKFIEYCKNNFPARYYSLIIGSHGGGARSANSDRNVVYDEVYGEWIYTAQWTDYLSKEHSVDILGLDACFMGNIEFLYQIRKNNGRFSADYVIASPPTEWGYGWNYSGIFQRITENEAFVVEDIISDITGGKRTIYASNLLTPQDLGKLIIEEQYNYTSLETDDQVLALYNTEKCVDLKKSLDALFIALKDNSTDVENIRGEGEINQADALFYFDSSSSDEWIDYCYFDIYDICTKIILSNNFSQYIMNIAAEVQEKTNEVILYSFSGRYFQRFQNNINGLSFFLPDGDALYEGEKVYRYQSWYNAIADNDSYGKLSFCSDNATMRNGLVENYFEVLDYWFDNQDESGGYNGYEY